MTDCFNIQSIQYTTAHMVKITGSVHRKRSRAGGKETPPEDTSLYHMGCENAVNAELLSSSNLCHIC